MKRTYTFLLITITFLTLNNVTLQASSLTYYEIYVAGMQVSSSNISSIRGRGIKGKISYNPKTKTLTLDNVTINTVRGVNAISNTGVEDLIINLVGNNTINVLGVSGIILNTNTTITGEGSLKVTSDYHSGIYIQPNTTLTISGGTVELKGRTGISGFDGTYGEKLIVTDATLKATGSPYGSITNLSALVLEGGCKIVQPVNAVFNRDLSFVEDDGAKVISQVVITKDIHEETQDY